MDLAGTHNNIGEKIFLVENRYQVKQPKRCVGAGPFALCPMCSQVGRFAAPAHRVKSWSDVSRPALRGRPCPFGPAQTVTGSLL